jgi:rhamnosyltransferase
MNHENLFWGQRYEGSRESQPMQDKVGNPNGVCAVIVTYNIGPEVHRCFDSIKDQVQEVLIVDNGSGPATTEELKTLESQRVATVVYNARNLGIAGALNQGARYAIEKGYRWLLSLDHDSEATPGMVQKLLEIYRGRDGSTAIVAANPLDRNIQSLWVQPEAPGTNANVVETGMALTSGSLIDTNIFKKVGFFNESLFLYCVDNDFCLRVVKAGLRIYVRCDALLLHAEGCKQRKRFFWRNVIHDGYGANARYYIARNAVFIIRNYYRDDPAGCYLMVKKKLLLDSVKIILYDKDRFRNMRSVLRGLLDGLAGRYGAGASAR